MGLVLVGLGDQVIVLIAHKVEEVEPEDDEEDLEDALEGEVVDEE
jgi:hypothetical protein